MSWVLTYKDKADLRDIPPNQWTLVCIRAVSGTMTFFLFNYAVRIISLSKLSFIANTSPIFAAIIAFLFLGESIDRHELIGMGVCILGVIVLV
jgi:drug/metabolite transporter (DMT)-like permease